MVIISGSLLAKVDYLENLGEKNKRSPQLNRRLSQLARLLEEEYITIKMFLW